MRKFYTDYFHISKDGKIRDKVMMMRVILTAFVMVSCLAAMSVTAYAYFTSDVTSSSSIIRSANFDVNVTVTDASNGSIKVETIEKNKYIAELKDAGTYTITVSQSESSTASTGFCIVELGNGVTLHTQQLYKANTAEQTSSVSFTIVNQAGEMTISFTPNWGTSSYRDNQSMQSSYIEEGETITLKNTASEAGAINAGETDMKETSDSTESNSLVIEAGDTLSEIAMKYNVSIEKLMAYNNLENADDLQIGQKIQIPPADWEIPADTEKTDDESVSDKDSLEQKGTSDMNGSDGEESAATESDSTDATESDTSKDSQSGSESEDTKGNES